MTIEMFKAHAPFAVMPAKFALSFPFRVSHVGRVQTLGVGHDDQGDR